MGIAFLRVKPVMSLNSETDKVSLSQSDYSMNELNY